MSIITVPCTIAQTDTISAGVTRITTIISAEHPMWCTARHHIDGDGCYSRDVDSTLGSMWLTQSGADVGLYVDVRPGTVLTEAQLAVFGTVTPSAPTVARAASGSRPLGYTFDVTDAVEDMTRVEVRKLLRQLARGLDAVTAAVDLRVPARAAACITGDVR